MADRVVGRTSVVACSCCVGAIVRWPGASSAPWRATPSSDAASDIAPASLAPANRQVSVTPATFAWNFSSLHCRFASLRVLGVRYPTWVDDVSRRTPNSASGRRRNTRRILPDGRNESAELAAARRRICELETELEVARRVNERSLGRVERRSSAPASWRRRPAAPPARDSRQPRQRRAARTRSACGIRRTVHRARRPRSPSAPGRRSKGRSLLLPQGVAGSVRCRLHRSMGLMRVCMYEHSCGSRKN